MDRLPVRHFQSGTAPISAGKPRSGFHRREGGGFVAAQRQQAFHRGVGNDVRLESDVTRLAAEEHIRLTHVAYKGGAAALLDLLAGHVKVGMLSWSSVAEHIRAGALMPLAVTSAQRVPYLPDLPTLRELGHGDFVATTWFSLSGPAGLPADIVERINHAVVKAMDRPQVKKEIEQDAIEARPMTAAQVTRFSQSEIDRWTPLIKTMMATRPQ